MVYRTDALISMLYIVVYRDD